MFKKAGNLLCSSTISFFLWRFLLYKSRSYEKIGKKFHFSKKNKESNKICYTKWNNIAVVVVDLTKPLFSHLLGAKETFNWSITDGISYYLVESFNWYSRDLLKHCRTPWSAHNLFMASVSSGLNGKVSSPLFATWYTIFASFCKRRK